MKNTKIERLSEKKKEDWLMVQDTINKLIDALNELREVKNDGYSHVVTSDKMPSYTLTTTNFTDQQEECLKVSNTPPLSGAGGEPPFGMYKHNKQDQQGVLKENKAYCEWCGTNDDRDHSNCNKPTLVVPPNFICSKCKKIVSPLDNQHPCTIVKNPDQQGEGEKVYISNGEAPVTKFITSYKERIIPKDLDLYPDNPPEKEEWEDSEDWLMVEAAILCGTPVKAVKFTKDFINKTHVSKEKIKRLAKEYTHGECGDDEFKKGIKYGVIGLLEDLGLKP